MDNFDPYNVLLAIATNISVLLMTAFVLQDHIWLLCWRGGPQTWNLLRAPKSLSPPLHPLKRWQKWKTLKCKLKRWWDVSGSRSKSGGLSVHRAADAEAVLPDVSTVVALSRLGLLFLLLFFLCVLIHVFLLLVLPADAAAEISRAEQLVYGTQTEFQSLHHKCDSGAQNQS